MIGKYLYVTTFFFLTCNIGQSLASVVQTATYNGHSYHLLDTDGTKWWHEAENEAVSLGGHLVTINDAAENQWVFETFAPIAESYASENNLPDQGFISLWIGLSDHQTEGTYKWSSGESLEYSNWAAGQPQHGPSDEDFIGIYVNFGDPGKWHDLVGDTRAADLPFGVVEVVPLPAAGWLFVSSIIAGVGLVKRRSAKS